MAPRASSRRRLALVLAGLLLPAALFVSPAAADTDPVPVDTGSAQGLVENPAPDDGAAPEGTLPTSDEAAPGAEPTSEATAPEATDPEATDPEATAPEPTAAPTSAPVSDSSAAPEPTATPTPEATLPTVPPCADCAPAPVTDSIRAVVAAPEAGANVITYDVSTRSFTDLDVAASPVVTLSESLSGAQQCASAGLWEVGASTDGAATRTKLTYVPCGPGGLTVDAVTVPAPLTAGHSYVLIVTARTTGYQAEGYAHTGTVSVGGQPHTLTGTATWPEGIAYGGTDGPRPTPTPTASVVMPTAIASGNPAPGPAPIPAPTPAPAPTAPAPTAPAPTAAAPTSAPGGVATNSAPPAPTTPVRPTSGAAPLPTASPISSVVDPAPEGLPSPAAEATALAPAAPGSSVVTTVSATASTTPPADHRPAITPRRPTVERAQESAETAGTAGPESTSHDTLAVSRAALAEASQAQVKQVSGGLPMTGMELAAMILYGGLLLGGGSALITLSRRRS